MLARRAPRLSRESGSPMRDCNRKRSLGVFRLKSNREPPPVAKRQRRPKKGSAAQQRRRLAELEGGLSLALAQVTEDSRHAAMTALEAVLSFIDSIPEWERRDFEAPLWALLARDRWLNRAHGQIASALSRQSAAMLVPGAPRRPSRLGGVCRRANRRKRPLSPHPGRCSPLGFSAHFYRRFFWLSPTHFS